MRRVPRRKLSYRRASNPLEIFYDALAPPREAGRPPPEVACSAPHQGGYLAKVRPCFHAAQEGLAHGAAHGPAGSGNYQARPLDALSAYLREGSSGCPARSPLHPHPRRRAVRLHRASDRAPERTGSVMKVVPALVFREDRSGRGGRRDRARRDGRHGRALARARRASRRAATHS